MGFRGILGCCVMAAFFASVQVYAAGPVVVEYFGQNSCSRDLDTQLHLHEFIRTREDVILINCRTSDHSEIDYTLDEEGQERQLERIKQRALEEYGVPVYYNGFCTKRALDYSLKNGELFRKSLLVMINGRWEANLSDILPAIKLGATDNLAEIGLTREGDVLHITIPEEIKSPKEGRALLNLFVYAPSTGIDVGKPQDLTPVTISQRERIDHMLDGYKRLVPLEEEEEQKPDVFVTEEEFAKERERKQQRGEDSKSHFFRPVAAMEKIGVWDGSEVQYDFSLAAVLSQAGLDAEKAGYVVVLQSEESGSASIVAAGEIVPSGEKMQKDLSKSEIPTEQE